MIRAPISRRCERCIRWTKASVEPSSAGALSVGQSVASGGDGRVSAIGAFSAWQRVGIEGRIAFNGNANNTRDCVGQQTKPVVAQAATGSFYGWHGAGTRERSIARVRFPAPVLVDTKTREKNHVHCTGLSPGLADGRTLRYVRHGLACCQVGTRSVSDCRHGVDCGFEYLVRAAETTTRGFGSQLT